MLTLYYKAIKILDISYQSLLKTSSKLFKMVLFYGKFISLFSKLINKAVPGKVPPISPEAINIHPATMYHKI